MTLPTSILLVEEDVSLQRAVAFFLRTRGYTVDVAIDAQEALEGITSSAPAIVALDLDTKLKNGVDLFRRVREQVDVPILVLSAETADSDRLSLFDRGADDYITKPFSAQLLLTRIQAALRRTTLAERATLGCVQVGYLTIDPDRRHVVNQDVAIELTPEEFELLALFARSPDRVLTHKTILKSLWGATATPTPAQLPSLVARLRRKIERDPCRPRYLLNESWIGYRLSTEPAIPAF